MSALAMLSVAPAGSSQRAESDSPIRSGPTRSPSMSQRRERYAAGGRTSSRQKLWALVPAWLSGASKKAGTACPITVPSPSICRSTSRGAVNEETGGRL